MATRVVQLVKRSRATNFFEDEQELESETEFGNDAISIDTVVIEANLMPLPEPIVEDEQFHSEP